MNWRAFALIFIATLATKVWAAESGLEPLPIANDDCVKLLPTADRQPAYPAEAYDLRRGGTVRIEMEFRDSQSAPRVKVLSHPDSPTGWALADSVEKFARMYRHGCAKPGDAPARIEQEFRFVPNDGRKVMWTSPAASPDVADTASQDCVTHEGLLSKPEFPFEAVRASASTRIVAKFEFLALNEPPTVSLLVPGTLPQFGESVRKFAAGYRLHCGTPPVRAVQTFDFLMSGQPFFVLQDACLKSFLGLTTNAFAKPVFFDLDGMGCPFDVRLRYWQPYFRNRVGEIGVSRPERRVFLDWLAGLQLNISPRIAPQVAGGEMTITVPCGKIDL